MSNGKISFIRQVWENQISGQKFITIPKMSGIRDGDFVIIELTEPPMNDGKCKICKRTYNDHTLKELYGHGIFGVK